MAGCETVAVQNPASLHSMRAGHSEEVAEQTIMLLYFTSSKGAVGERYGEYGDDA